MQGLGVLIFFGLLYVLIKGVGLMIGDVLVAAFPVTFAVIGILAAVVAVVHEGGCGCGCLAVIALIIALIFL